MGIYDKSDRAVGPDCLQPSGTVDKDLSALISSLIDQNTELLQKLAQLLQKLKELNSRKELADSIIAEAKIEAEKILAEAEQKGEALIEEKTQLAVTQGLRLIDKARDSALSIVDAVQKQAEAINGRANKRVRR
jgi:vacuolar-type H+-ATPase subunit H